MGILEFLKCILIDFTNDLMKYTIGWLIDAIAFLITLLPDTPFTFEYIEWGDFGNFIGYFIPVGDMITHMGYILTAITLWYGVQHAMRLVKAIR